MKNHQGDVALERMILAGLAQYGIQAYNEVADIISTQSFIHTNNQVIYACLNKALESTEVLDIPSVLTAANNLGLYEKLNSDKEIEFIKAIFNVPVKLDNLRKAAAKLKKIEIAKNLQLKLLEAHSELGEILGSENVDDILRIGENAVFDVAFGLTEDGESKPTKLLAEAKEYLDFKAENQSDILGISSGFPIYDEVIGGGMRRGSVNLLVARMKVGKSTLCKEIATHVALKLDIPVLILDTEMQYEDFLNKILASQTKTEIRQLETGKFADTIKEPELYQFVEENKESPLYYQKVAGKPFDEILSIIRRWITVDVGVDENGQTKDCLVIYDYFKLMDTESLEKMAEYQAMGFQIQRLTDFCNKYQVACFACVQANRDGITKETSDIISQSDRLLWLAGSATLFKRKTNEEIAADDIKNGNMKLIPLEARYGPCLDEGDYINLFFDKETSHISELNTRSQAVKDTKVDVVPI